MFWEKKVKGLFDLIFMILMVIFLWIFGCYLRFIYVVYSKIYLYFYVFNVIFYSVRNLIILLSIL